METDFNKATVDDLPDLSEGGVGSTTAPATGSPNPPDIVPEPPEGGPQEGGEPPIEGTGTQPPAGETPEGGETPPEGGETPPVQETPSTPPAEPAELNPTHLSEMSDGRINSAEDFKGLLSHYDEVISAANENPEMFLPEGKAREAFKYAMQFPGDNAALANQSFHHVMSLNPETLSPKELQFEAYLLREENADLLSSPERAKQLFDAEYEAIYGDVESLKDDDPVLHRKHEMASNQASKEITDLQTKFQSETPADDNSSQVSAEDQQAYETTVNKTLAGHDGLTINFSDDDEGMNFVLEDQAGRKEHFQESVRNPNLWFQSKIEAHIDKEGNFDSDGFANEMLFMINAKEIAALSYKQGQTDATIKREEGLRNEGDVGAGETPPVEEKKTFFDAMANAIDEAG